MSIQWINGGGVGRWVEQWRMVKTFRGGQVVQSAKTDFRTADNLMKAAIKQLQREGWVCRAGGAGVVLYKGSEEVKVGLVSAKGEGQ